MSSSYFSLILFQTSGPILFCSLGIAGVNLDELSLILGGLSIGISIGLNTYIADMICGLIILIKNPIRIDD